MKWERNIESFRLDATYGFQSYPIIALSNEEKLKEYNLLLEKNEDCYQCAIRNKCTLHKKKELVEKSIEFDKVTANIQEQLIVPEVYWCHTGQCSFEEWGKVWYEGENTKVFAQNQNAGLRIRKNFMGIIEYAGFELENYQLSDVDFIVYLMGCFQSSTDYSLFICTKGRNAKLLSFGSEQMKDWLINNII